MEVAGWAAGGVDCFYQRFVATVTIIGLGIHDASGCISRRFTGMSQWFLPLMKSGMPRAARQILRQSWEQNQL
jgi:hypothetical protein